MRNQLEGKGYHFRAAYASLLIAALLLSFWQPMAVSAAGSTAAVTLASPDSVVAVESDSKVTLTWNMVPGAAKFNVYRSMTEGEGYALLNTVPSSVYTATYSLDDTGLANQTKYYYVLTAVDWNGIESAYSNEIAAMPHLVINWVGTITPETVANYVLGSTDPLTITGKVFIPDHTGPSGPAPGMKAQLGYGPAGTAPITWTHWYDAQYAGVAIDEDPKANDWYTATFRPESSGDFNTVYRFSSTNGRDWVYGGFTLINPTLPHDLTTNEMGVLHVAPSGDGTAPSVPGDPTMVARAATTVTLAWGISTDNAAMYRYDIFRATASGGPYTLAGSVDAAASSLQYQDTGLVAGTNYYYVVQAVDTSFNRSAYSKELPVTTVMSMVPVTIQVTVPAFTPGGTIYINQAVNPDGTLGAQSWTALALSAGTGPNTYTTTQTLREGIKFSFRFSRGSQATVQTNSDGDSPALAPDFTVTAGMPTVLRSVLNWDDPIVIAYWPSTANAEMSSPVAITWSQPMPAATSFTVNDVTSGSPASFPGTFSTNPTDRQTIFQPTASYSAGRKYSVSVSGQPGMNGVAQTVPVGFTFSVQLYHLHLPIIKK